MENNPDLSAAVERYAKHCEAVKRGKQVESPYWYRANLSGWLALNYDRLNDDARTLASAYVGLTNREERQCLPCSEHEVIVEGEMPHQWTEPNNVVPWEHCRVCGIIRRRDDKNLPCKGPVRIGPRREETTL